MQPDRIADDLLDASLPQREWTHRAHITAAHVLIRRHGPTEALTLCRTSIPRLNEAHGVANSDTVGYHETLTVFFVAAVADAVARGLTIDDTVAELDRDAALRYWSEPVLMGVEARRAFVPPDRATPRFALAPSSGITGPSACAASGSAARCAC
ncbi:MAG: hypothetical protein ACR2JV_07535 [Gaiellales bacterium]